MYSHRRWLDQEADDKTAERQTAGLVGFVIILLLLIVSLFLVQRLRSATAIEDCLLSGRSNCDILVTGAH